LAFWNSSWWWVWTSFRPQRWAIIDDEGSFEGIKKKAREWIEDCFEKIEDKLNGVYAVGEQLTAVDPNLFVFYRWGNAVGFQTRERWPKYTKLIENLVERPAVKATLEAENIGSTL
jgi:glutathione S-transferase